MAFQPGPVIAWLNLINLHFIFPFFELLACLVKGTRLHFPQDPQSSLPARQLIVSTLTIKGACFVKKCDILAGTSHFPSHHLLWLKIVFVSPHCLVITCAQGCIPVSFSIK